MDKCRAVLAGTSADYHFDCPLDNLFFNFTGITAEEMKDFVGTGASDDDFAAWLQEKSEVQDKQKIIQWNNDLRGRRICEMPIELQEFLETYIPEFCGDRPVIFWFDVYDIEEKRI